MSNTMEEKSSDSVVDDDISTRTESKSDRSPRRSHSRSHGRRRSKERSDHTRSSSSRSHRRSRSRSRDRGRRSSGHRRSRSRSRGDRSHRSSRNHRRSPERRRHRSRSSPRDRPRPRRLSSRSRSPSRSRSRSPSSGVPKPNLALIQQLLKQQQATADPQLTKMSRRLYCGNLPVGIGLSEPVLNQFFTQSATAVGITTPSPISSIWVSAEATFCFVEFRAVSDCTRCLLLFDGLTLSGRSLRVGRPADYQEAPEHLKTYVLEQPGLPPAPPHCSGRQPAAFGAGPAITACNAIASMAGAPEPVKVPPTEVLMLENMTSRNDLIDDEEFADIELDIQEECENFGKVIKVVIPRPDKNNPSNDPKGLCKIWVRFSSSGECQMALDTLGAKMFNGKKVAANFYPLYRFEANDFE